MRSKLSSLFSFLLISVLVFSACSQKTTTALSNNSNKASSYTYLALGDSYTIGEGVSTEDRWPNQLATDLLKHKVHFSEVDIIAKTGWTTADLLNAIDQQNPKVHDFVSILIGVNNQYQSLSFADFKTEFEQLIAISKRLSHKGKNGVFVVSIPDYSLTPFVKKNQDRIATELDKYNSFMKEKCEQKGIPFVDITSVSRSLGSASNAIAEDGLHPSGFQYGQWVNEIVPVVLGL